MDWLRQSCQRAIEQAAVNMCAMRTKLGAFADLLHAGPGAALRALAMARRSGGSGPAPFHILQNHELLNAAVVSPRKSCLITDIFLATASGISHSGDERVTVARIRWPVSGATQV
jgi:hypothetical protein